MSGVDPDPLKVLKDKVAEQKSDHVPLDHVAVAEREKPVDERKDFCLKLLEDGCVNSFVDFFHLTHGGGSGRSGSEAVEGRQLEFVRDTLADAELARREGKTDRVSHAFAELADLYSNIGESSTATYFREKCWEIAKLSEDREKERVACRKLGFAYQDLGNIERTVQLLEEAFELSVAGSAERVESNGDLAMAYLTLAHDLENKEDLNEALTVHDKSLKRAEDAGDSALVGQAHFHMGKCLEKLERGSEAIQHYMQYLDVCRELGDDEGQSAAAFALSSAYQLTGDIAGAVTHLEAYTELAEGKGEIRSQAEACCSLGEIHSRQGDARSAVHYFERYFELARTVGDRDLVDKARTHLGVARGNLVFGSYMDVVMNDLNALLKWKARRTPFAEVIDGK